MDHEARVLLLESGPLLLLAGLYFALALVLAPALWRARRWLPSVPLRGEQEGFTNILEASRSLDAVVARYDPRPGSRVSGERARSHQPERITRGDGTGTMNAPPFLR